MLFTRIAFEEIAKNPKVEGWGQYAASFAMKSAFQRYALDKIGIDFGRILGVSTRNYSNLHKNTRKKVPKNARNCEFFGTFSIIYTQNNCS